MRTLAFLAAWALLPAAAAAQPIGGNGGTGMAVLRACATAQLRASVLSDTSAMMHRELRIGLANVSERACAIDGYPAVRIVDERGNVQIAAESFVTAPAPRLFTLAPGESAAFLLRIAHGDGAIEYRTAPKLAIVPPGGLSALMLALDVPAAPSVEVTAVLPAATWTARRAL